MKFVFQPLIDLQRHALAGFEALARFRDGRTAQAHFDEARLAGSLVDLELRALERIIDASQVIPDGLLLTMNASGPAIDAFAQQHPQLDPRLSWGLELHELSSPELCGRARISADELGCLLLVDDAGIGYATRERITMLKPHIVKLDRSLFIRYQSSAAAHEHVDILLAAARGIGAKTLVEGVETAHHLALARDLGFDYAQGFYFSPGLDTQQLPEAMAGLRQRLGIDTPGF
ncbi:EAL domain-containing protein [Glutamicibacter mishrai]|uniref:EAL domain-containing protein n=1 Tax=Glutamicibacter mishrai TaxID=1775880 RepID=A0A6H0SH50_9MICC|nr:EAL domain-containing protein [Glutamicibacter mishrai]QIV86982.1 EAL domain-containing protein [Glutamicibacter mishrai]